MTLLNNLTVKIWRHKPLSFAVVVADALYAGAPPPPNVVYSAFSYLRIQDTNKGEQ